MIKSEDQKKKTLGDGGAASQFGWSARQPAMARWLVTLVLLTMSCGDEPDAPPANPSSAPSPQRGAASSDLGPAKRDEPPRAADRSAGTSASARELASPPTEDPIAVLAREFEAAEPAAGCLDPRVVLLENLHLQRAVLVGDADRVAAGALPALSRVPEARVHGQYTLEIASYRVKNFSVESAASSVDAVAARCADWSTCRALAAVTKRMFPSSRPLMSCGVPIATTGAWQLLIPSQTFRGQ